MPGASLWIPTSSCFLFFCSADFSAGVPILTLAIPQSRTFVRKECFHLSHVRCHLRQTILEQLRSEVYCFVQCITYFAECKESARTFRFGRSQSGFYFCDIVARTVQQSLPRLSIDPHTAYTFPIRLLPYLMRHGYAWTASLSVGYVVVLIQWITNTYSFNWVSFTLVVSVNNQSSGTRSSLASSTYSSKRCLE
jgi:hypothetical protein